MEIFLDCLPCVLRQVLEASRKATDSPDLQVETMEEAIRLLAHYKEYGSSPQMVKALHRIVKDRTGVSDPYKTTKERDMNAAKASYPLLNQFLEEKQGELYWILKIAATGNIIDSALYDKLNFLDCLETELEKEFSVCDLDIFEEKLKTANNILIIGDNAGESVFDKILAERLADHDLIYAVRSEAIINDATMQDAYDSGLEECAEIISTGCGSPGAVLEECSGEFLEIFSGADIVISKGQGNFEALSGCGRPVFFLLKAKCSMIAGRLGVDLNDYVFLYDGTELI